MLLCLLRVDLDPKPGHKSGRFFSALEIAAVALGIACFFIGNDMTGIRENLGVLAYALDVMSIGTVLVVFSFEGGAVSKSLNSRPLQTLGGLSMYIFLVHYPFVVYKPILGMLLGLSPSADLAVCEAAFILAATFGFSLLAAKILGARRR